MTGREGFVLQLAETGDLVELPRYRSHKQVWALEIAQVDGLKLMFTDKTFAPATMTPDMFARYFPVPGDFYVVYADGYKSFSPRKAFLEGYTREDA